MALEAGALTTTIHIPQPYRLVSAPGDEGLPIGCERQAPRGVGAEPPLAQLVPGLCIPEPHVCQRVVRIPAYVGQEPTPGRERQGDNWPSSRTVQRGQLGFAGDIPNLHLPLYAPAGEEVS